MRDVYSVTRVDRTLILLCLYSESSHGRNSFFSSYLLFCFFFFFFSSRRRHTRSKRDWSSDVCSSDLHPLSIVRPNRLDERIKTESRRRTRAPNSLAASARGAPGGRLRNRRNRDRKSVV